MRGSPKFLLQKLQNFLSTRTRKKGVNFSCGRTVPQLRWTNPRC